MNVIDHIDSKDKLKTYVVNNKDKWKNEDVVDTAAALVALNDKGNFGVFYSNINDDHKKVVRDVMDDGDLYADWFNDDVISSGTKIEDLDKLIDEVLTNPNTHTELDQMINENMPEESDHELKNLIQKAIDEYDDDKMNDDDDDELRQIVDNALKNYSTDDLHDIVHNDQYGFDDDYDFGY